MRDNPPGPERQKENPLAEFILELGQRYHGLLEDDFDKDFVRQLKELTVSPEWMELIKGHEQDIDHSSGLENILNVNKQSVDTPSNKLFMRHIGLTAGLVGNDILTTPEFEKSVLQLFEPSEACATGKHVLQDMLKAAYAASEDENYVRWMKDGIDQIQSRYPASSAEEVLERRRVIQNDATLKVEFREAAESAFALVQLSPKWRVFPALYKEAKTIPDRLPRTWIPALESMAGDILIAIRYKQWGMGEADATTEEISRHIAGEYLHPMLAATFPEFILIQPRKSIASTTP